MTEPTLSKPAAWVYVAEGCDNCAIICATLEEHGWTVFREPEDAMPEFVRETVEKCQAGELPGILLGGAVVTTPKAVLMGATDLRTQEPS